MKRLYVRKSAGLALADLLVVVGLIPLVGVALVGCWSNNRGGTNNRVKCASNLRQIGTALMMYGNENRGAYPRTTFVGGTTVTPTWGTGADSSDPFSSTGPAPNDVTAGLYLLLRTQEITSDVFVCPSSNAEKWDFGGGSNTAMKWSNWQGNAGIKRHLSYSYHNPYADDGYSANVDFKRIGSISAEFAFAADMNPGTSSGKNVLTITSTASAKDMQQANSRNHDADGQNVLFADGHVEFVSNPFVGVNRDMIYARRAGATGWASSEIRNSPFDMNDSVLLPAEE
jgi:prepilin-type processing-associated H-X9-DG protein